MHICFLIKQNYKMITEKRLLINVGIITLFFSSCALSPVGTHYESAKSLKKNQLEVTGSFTHYEAADDEESNLLSNYNFGFRAGYGISDQFDIKVRYEILTPIDDEVRDLINPVHFGSIEPKFSFANNKFAVKLPLNIYSSDFSDGSNPVYSMSPTFMGTADLKQNKIETTFSATYHYFFYNDLIPIMAFNFGLGFSSNLEKWAIRPELGVLIGSHVFFGIGYNYNFDLNK